MNFKALFILKFLHHFLSITFAREQAIAPVRYVVASNEITLPCARINDAQLLKWRFVRNGTTFPVDAAQVFPGDVRKVFGSFNIPENRAVIVGGSFKITDTKLLDEGHYWCEISSATAETAFSDRIPLHVWYKPADPTLVALANTTLTENIEKQIARCSSKGGKPGSTITWLNGSKIMQVPDVKPVFTKSSFSDDLTDVSYDLKIEYPTRFDHNRVFTCKVDHPSYYGEAKTLNITLKVMYHPVNINMWANATSKYVFCHADGFPNPKYDWVLPGNIGGIVPTDTLYMDDLLRLPGSSYFKCTAYNGIGENATIRITVDDLVYPDGKPGWLGLDWWIWAAIISGIIVFIIVIVLIIYCHKRRNKAHGKSLQTKYTKGDSHKKPIVNVSNSNNYSGNNTYRDRDDSFDDDVSPTPDTRQKTFMGQDTYTSDNVTLVPSTVRGSRDNLYSGNRSNSRENLTSSREELRASREQLHASRDQLNQAAEHISTLNKSWDYLSRSREELNNVQSELQYNRNDNTHRSHERLDEQDNYPYIDNSGRNSQHSAADQYNTGSYRGNNYTEKGQYVDGYDVDQYKTYNAPPGYNEEPQSYNNSNRYDNQQYNDDTQSSRNYDGQYQDQYDSQNNYNQDQYDERGQYDDRYNNDQQSYNNTRDYQYDQDNEQGYNSNSYNYRPARIV